MWSCYTTFILAGLLLFCNIAFGDTTVAFSKPIQIANSNFIDTYNRTRLFHSVNVVYKEFPWHPSNGTFDPQNSLNELDMKRLAEWGFTAVRLGVMWPGVAVAQGVYNKTYLEFMRNTIIQLGKHGIYTIVDFHQDLFSRKFCGEGVPDWAVPKSPVKFPEPIHKPYPNENGTQYPSIKQCFEHGFGGYYMSYAVGHAFQNLYDNKHNLYVKLLLLMDCANFSCRQDHLGDFWQQVVAYLADLETILGYELMNEPWAGNVYEDPKRLIPGYTDKHSLAPMYKKLHEIIRQIDNERIIFFEPMVVDFGNSGFVEGPGGPSYNDRQAYSYHVYCSPIDKHGDPTKSHECNIFDEDLYNARASDYKRLGVAGFMTEFGAMLGTPKGVASLDFVTSQADKHIQSWSYWAYKEFKDITTLSPDGGESFYFNNGTLDFPKVRALSRTYAPAIAGVPTQHFFNATTSQFVLQYTINPLATANTEIYHNVEYYYNGKSPIITITPANMATVKSISQNKSEIIHNAGASGSLKIVVSAST